MRLVASVAVLCVLTCTSLTYGQEVTAEPSAAAQPVEAPDPVEEAVRALFDVGTTEWMVTGGPGFGVVVFHSAGGYRYAMQAISWGRILTRPLGSGVWRGRFTWAIEGIPIYAQYEPNRTYGYGFTPLVWRWNFEPRGKIAPYAELAGGALFTNNPVPLRTTTANFTAHAGAGVRLFLAPHQAFVVGYRFHHISNGNRLETNPGVNAHVLQFGVSLMRPRK